MGSLSLSRPEVLLQMPLRMDLATTNESLSIIARIPRMNPVAPPCLGGIAQWTLRFELTVTCSGVSQLAHNHPRGSYVSPPTIYPNKTRLYPEIGLNKKQC
jgi:hypothetical protein